MTLLNCTDSTADSALENVGRLTPFNTRMHDLDPLSFSANIIIVMQVERVGTRSRVGYGITVIIIYKCLVSSHIPSQ